MVPKLGRRTRVAAVSLLTATALLLTGCSGNGALASDAEINSVDAALAERIDTAIASAMQQSGSTAAIVGVWTTEAGEYVHGYGDGVTANSLVRGAQATQPVLCALLLDLVDEGVVALDREVSEDLPRQVGIEGVTYGQLCTAQSGLADYKARIGDIFANNPTRPWPDRELLAHGLAHSPLSWPGLDVHASDTDALLLARALRGVTGTQLPELLETHVFSEAGMPSSYFPSDPLTETTLPQGGLTGVTYPASGGAPVCEVGVVDVSEVSPSMLGSAGATVTTVTDLKNFYTSYLGGGFGGTEYSGLVTEVISTTNPIRNENGEAVTEGEEAAARIAAIDDPNGQKWGFGLEKVQSLYGMSGAITGTITASYHDPATGFSVVVVLNNSSVGAGFARTLAFELAAIAAEAGVGPEITWSAEERANALAAAAICQPAPEEEAAPEG